MFAEDAPIPMELIGPFAARSNDGDGFEITDSNGVTAIWCRGERLAGVLVKLLNLCWKTKTRFAEEI